MHFRNSRAIAATVALALVCLLLSRTAFANVASFKRVGQEEIVVSEGTPIKVITTTEITSKEVKPNDRVSFTVKEDVVISGQVVVRTGTLARGIVVKAEKGGYMGKSGKLAIQVESTKTVDGAPLKLRAAKGRGGDDNTSSTIDLSFISPLSLFKKAGDAKIDAGTPVIFYVAQEKHFRLEGSILIAVAVDAATSAANSEDVTVYIYRPKKTVGGALEPSVFVDEIELARMDNGRYLALKLKPGKHVVRMTEENKGYAFEMAPGHTYYFRISIEAGTWKGQGSITLEDADRAIAEIRKLKFLGQDKIKAPRLVVELSPK